MWYCNQCEKKNDGRFCTYCGEACVEINDTDEKKAATEREEQPMVSVAPLSSDPIEHGVIPREEAKEKPGAASLFSAAALFRRSCDNEDAVISSEEEKSSGESLEKPETPPIEDKAPATTEEEMTEAKAPLTEAVSNQEEEEKQRAAAVPYIEEDGDDIASPFRHNNEENVAQGEHTLFRPAKSPKGEEAPAAISESPKAIPHRVVKEAPVDKGMRIGKWIVLVGGIIAGIIIIIFSYLLFSLLSGNDHHEDQEPALPQGTDVYYYVSGVDDFASLYQDNSITSEVLAQLNNGDPVELIHEENYKFLYVLDHESGEYGYVLSGDLVDDRAKIEFTREEEAINAAAEPEDKTVIDTYYVVDTKSHLPVHAKAYGASASRAKLNNGDKVGLVQMTSDEFWYVYAYEADVYGYVSVPYLSHEKPTAEEDEAAND